MRATPQHLIDRAGGRPGVGRPAVPALLTAILLAALPATPLTAQEVLVASRPGLSNTAEVVPRGRVEANLGVGWGREEEDEILSVGQALIRAGLAPRVELRVGLNSWVDSRGPAGDFSGIEDTVLGLKVGLSEGNDGLGLDRPQTSLILEARLPTGSGGAGSDVAEPAAILLLGWDLTSRLHLDGNLGAFWLAGVDGRFAEISSSLGLSIGLGGDWGAYLEYAGFYPAEAELSASHFLFAAVTRLTSPKTQLDLGAGRGLHGQQPQYFVSAGIAHRW